MARFLPGWWQRGGILYRYLLGISGYVLLYHASARFFFFLRGGFSLLKVKAGMAREAFPCFRPGNRQLAEPLI